MLITFSGLDGAGKSTVIGRLRPFLEAQRRPVIVRHMNHDMGLYAAVRALLGRRQPPGLAGHDNSAGARWMGLRRVVLWNKPVRRILYLADLLIFLVYWGYYHRVKHSVLIMDRYFYDTLVDVAGPRSWGYLRFLAAITPEPSIAVLLDVGPEVAFARKGERSLEELRQRSWAYKRVFRWLKCPVVLAPAGVGDVAAQLERLILERLIEETR